MKPGNMVKLRLKLKELSLRSEDGNYNYKIETWFHTEIGFVLKKKVIKINSSLNLIDVLIYISDGKVGWVYARDLEVI